MNEMCAKHDKIFNETKPCEGCVLEAANVKVSSAAAPQAKQSLEEAIRAARERA